MEKAPTRVERQNLGCRVPEPVRDKQNHDPADHVKQGVFHLPLSVYPANPVAISGDGAN
jgi:hypothetical protein